MQFEEDHLMRTERIERRLTRRTAVVPCLAAAFLLTAVSASAADRVVDSRTKTARLAPKDFGTLSYGITKITATAFYPSTSQRGYATTGSLGRMGDVNNLTDFFAPVDLPAGVIIDDVGLNSTTDTAFALGVALHNRTKDGNLTTITDFSSTVHGWDTEFNAVPAGYLWYGLTGNALILHVQLAPEPNLQA